MSYSLVQQTGKTVRVWSLFGAALVPACAFGTVPHAAAQTVTPPDSQNLQIGHLLSQRWVQADATLLDKCKVKSCREGNRLEVGGDACWGVTKVTAGRVVIGSGNRRMLPDIQTRGCLSEWGIWIEIGFVMLRYRDQKLVSIMSCVRFVSRPICRAPVALMLGKTRNRSRLSGLAPFDSR